MDLYGMRVTDYEGKNRCATVRIVPQIFLYLLTSRKRN